MRSNYVRIAAAAGLAVLAGTAQAELVVATTASGFLISFDSATPGITLSGAAIQGLGVNEEIVGLDRRPSTGELIGLGSFGIMYSIDPVTAVATSLGLLDGAVLSGSAFGFDFNPVADRIRIASDMEQNLRVNPTVSPMFATVDTSFTYAAGDPNFGEGTDISFAAYSNNFAGALATTLYVIDAANDVISTVNNPNDGQLTTIAPLNVDIGPRGGFDISGATGTAYLAALPASGSTSAFYTVNLDTGELTLIGEISGGLELRTLTVVPAPSSLALFGITAIALRRRRRN